MKKRKEEEEEENLINVHDPAAQVPLPLHRGLIAGQTIDVKTLDGRILRVPLKEVRAAANGPSRTYGSLMHAGLESGDDMTGGAPMSLTRACDEEGIAPRCGQTDPPSAGCMHCWLATGRATSLRCRLIAAAPWHGMSASETQKKTPLKVTGPTAPGGDAGLRARREERGHADLEAARQ